MKEGKNREKPKATEREAMKLNKLAHGIGVFKVYSARNQSQIGSQGP